MKGRANGCFAHQTYEDGTAVRLGFDPRNSNIYFMFGNKAWKSLEAGKVYQMRFVFDDVKSYDGEMTGHRLGEGIYLDHSAVSATFTKDFMARGGVRIYYRGAQITHLSLRNTYAAVGEVVNCQREFASTGNQGGNSPQPANDPFARGASRDPFSR